MTKLQIEIDLKDAPKPWLCTATDDSRPVLTCMHIKRIDKRTVAMEAADGFRMLTARYKATSLADVPADLDVLVPAALLRRIRPWQYRSPLGRIELDLDAKTASVSLDRQGTVAVAPFATGTFPDVDKLIPQPSQWMAGDNYKGVNADLLTSTVKALNNRPVRIFSSGTWREPMVLTRGNRPGDMHADYYHAVAVLMPTFVQW